MGLFSRSVPVHTPTETLESVAFAFRNLDASSQLVNTMAQEVSTIASNVSKSMANALTKQLEHSNKKFLSTIDLLPDIVIVKDPSNRWVNVNAAGRKFFGFSGSEYIGKTNEELAETYPHLAEFLSVGDETDKQAWKERNCRFRNVIIPRDGNRPIIYDIIKCATFEDNQRQELISIWRDVTDLCDIEPKPVGCPLVEKNARFISLADSPRTCCDGACITAQCNKCEVSCG